MKTIPPSSFMLGFARRLFVCACFFTVLSALNGFTDRDAEAIVEAEAAIADAKKTERMAQIYSVPASRETVLVSPEARVTVREVEPPPVFLRVEPEETTVPSVVDVSALQKMEEETFALSVTVAGEASEVRSLQRESEWRIQYEGDLSWLPGFVTLEANGKRYTFISMVQRVDGSVKRDSSLAAAEPDAETGSAIALLLGHYDEHRAEYEAAARKAEILEVARKRYEAENPPHQRREVVINVWKRSGVGTEP